MNAKNHSIPSLVYTRSLWTNVFAWYTNAEAKAQILLTLAGAFLSFVTSSIFVKKSELAEIVKLFGPETWSLLGLTVLGLFATIAAALFCLRSRIAGPEDLDAHIQEINCDYEGKCRQWPETLWFFGMIARLEDRKKFQDRLSDFSEYEEVRALSSQIFLVSRNVLKKHIWVNRGFLFMGLTLIFFLTAGVNYVMRVAAASQ